MKTQYVAHCSLPVTTHRGNHPANSRNCHVQSFREAYFPIPVLSGPRRRGRPAAGYSAPLLAAGHHARPRGGTSAHESVSHGVCKRLRSIAHPPQPTGVQRCRRRAPRVPSGARFYCVVFAGGKSSCTDSGANQFRSQKNEVRSAGPKISSHKGLCFGTSPASHFPSKPSNPWAQRLIAPRFPALAARSRLGSGRSIPLTPQPMSHGLCLANSCAGSAVGRFA